MKPYRVLVTGSRSWRSPNDRDALRDALDAALAVHPSLVVVHGGCTRGADFLAARWAEERANAGANVAVEAHPADWDAPCRPQCKHGYKTRDGRPYCSAAGMYRNADMVAAGADICLAFIRGNSHGATHCVNLAEKAGIPVRRWTA